MGSFTIRTTTPKALLAALLGLPLALLPGCGGPASEVDPSAAPTPATSTDATRLELVEATAELGLDFVHNNGSTGAMLFPEIVGPGIGLLDFDSDGDLDIYAVQGAVLDPSRELLLPPGAEPPWRDRLYRNDLEQGPDGRVSLRFVEVTDEVGLAADGFGIGVACDDYDADGHVDLYLTNFGPNQLWRNRGDGSFEDVTRATGTAAGLFGSSAAFLDYDKDGLLDLYVGNYVDFRLDNHKQCFAETGALDYCGPLSYKPLADQLFRNLGQGRFEDVSVASRVAATPTNTLGISVADIDGDAWPDILVSSDGLANQLLMNLGDGTFEDRALLAGVAFNEDGAAEAGMGVDAADFDEDGDLDLFLAHLTGETNTLYLNDGTGFFSDSTLESGLGAASMSHTGFGTSWLDVDNDGWLDLFVANGAVYTIEEQAAAGVAYPFRERNLLFHNRSGRFEEVRDQAGSGLEPSEVSRGAAAGDLDNDGDPDLVVGNNRGPLRVMLNQTRSANGWLGLELYDARGWRTGSSVLARLTDGRSLHRRARTDGSYASCQDSRVLLGLGKAGVEEIVVTWPDGSRERWTGLAAGRYHRLEQGQGEPPGDTR